VSDDPDLRSQLERIAATVGDPPEHGLDRVAARRHRRLRRRRGAVATAAVLAVLAAGGALINRAGDGRESVTASETASPTGAPAEVPNLVEVRCEPTGIVVPIASVRPQRDGLHIRVINSLPVATVLEVDGPGWASGDIPVPAGVKEVQQPVPPGELTIGCEIDGEMQRRRVDLVDPSGYYRVPELGCERADAETLRDLPVDPPVANIVAAARSALDPHVAGGTDRDQIGALRGYQGQRLGVATDDPVVQVTRDGEVIAFAHVRGNDGATGAPWTTVAEAQVCRSARASGTTTSTEPTTTTTEAQGGAVPPA
jgi:hypothetical protein